MSAERGKLVTLIADDGVRHEVERLADGAAVGQQVTRVATVGPGQFRAGERIVWGTSVGAERWVFLDGRAYVFRPERPGHRARGAAADHAGHSAPMPATVTRIEVSPGDRVRAGDVIATLEAMKMELPIRAAVDGTVKTVACQVGDLVQPGEPLLEIEAGS